MKKLNTKGFSAIETILIVVLIGIIGGVGYYVYNSQKKTNATLDNAAKSQGEPQKAGKKEDKSLTQTNTKKITLANNTVSFSVPESWTKDGAGCVKDAPAYSELDYIDSVALLPGEKLPTIYGNGTEFFHINICVFANKNNLSPKDWLNKGPAGYPNDGDDISEQKINDNPAYYLKFKKTSFHGYDEVHYAIAANGKIVYINARTFETSNDVPGAGDFRKFESDINKLVNTVTFN